MMTPHAQAVLQAIRESHLGTVEGGRVVKLWDHEDGGYYVATDSMSYGTALRWLIRWRRFRVAELLGEGVAA